MYKAKIEIGGYKVGDEVPANKAEIWESMYLESPVEKVSNEKPTVIEKSIETKPAIIKDGNILKDYLGRNKNVLKKNIAEDDLTKENLEELLAIEESDKKRSAVIFAIKNRLKSSN